MNDSHSNEPSREKSYSLDLGVPKAGWMPGPMLRKLVKEIDADIRLRKEEAEPDASDV